jgi:orotate phosphoribosyltransferase
MNLAQVLRTAPDAPSAFQSARQRSAELYADILAVAPGGDGRVDIEAVQSRPSILRRTAALLSEALPPGTDRLVCAAPDGIAVTTALALHTGLPFATVTGAGDDARLTGEAHAGEHAVVVVPLAGAAQDAVSVVRAALDAGMRVSHVLSVLDTSSGSGDRSVADVLQEQYEVRFHALFPAHSDLPALPAFSTTDQKEVDPR